MVNAVGNIVVQGTQFNTENDNLSDLAKEALKKGPILHSNDNYRKRCLKSEPCYSSKLGETAGRAKRQVRRSKWYFTDYASFTPEDDINSKKFNIPKSLRKSSKPLPPIIDEQTQVATLVIREEDLSAGTKEESESSARKEPGREEGSENRPRSSTSNSGKEGRSHVKGRDSQVFGNVIKSLARAVSSARDNQNTPTHIKDERSKAQEGNRENSQKLRDSTQQNRVLTRARSNSSAATRSGQKTHTDKVPKEASVVDRIIAKGRKIIYPNSSSTRSPNSHNGRESGHNPQTATFDTASLQILCQATLLYKNCEALLSQATRALAQTNAHIPNGNRVKGRGLIPDGKFFEGNGLVMKDVRQRLGNRGQVSIKLSAMPSAHALMTSVRLLPEETVDSLMGLRYSSFDNDEHDGEDGNNNELVRDDNIYGISFSVNTYFIEGGRKLYPA